MVGGMKTRKAGQGVKEIIGASESPAFDGERCYSHEDLVSEEGGLAGRAEGQATGSVKAPR